MVSAAKGLSSYGVVLFVMIGCVSGLDSDEGQIGLLLPTEWQDGEIAAYRLLQEQDAMAFRAEAVDSRGVGFAVFHFAISELEEPDAESGQAFPLSFTGSLVSPWGTLEVQKLTGADISYTFQDEAVSRDLVPSETYVKLASLWASFLSDPALGDAFQARRMSADAPPRGPNIVRQASSNGPHVYTRWATWECSHVHHSPESGTPQWCQTTGGAKCTFPLWCPGVEHNSSCTTGKIIYDGGSSHPDGFHSIASHSVW